MVTHMGAIFLFTVLWSHKTSVMEEDSTTGEVQQKVQGV